MRRLLVNSLLLIVVVWIALLQHCLIVASGMPVSARIFALLLFQMVIGTLVFLLINGAFPAVTEATRGIRNFRLKFIVFGVPAIIFLASPALVSETLHQARYGSVDRILVNSHVAHDFRCCWNPFARTGSAPK
jgi:hypothetical protein